MSDEVIKKVVAGFMAVRKSPFRRYIGPARNSQAPDQNGYVPSPNPEKLTAVAQVEQIASLAQPLIENYGQEQALIEALEKLVSQLQKLVAGLPDVEKSVTPAPTHRRRFVRVIEPTETVQVVGANSLDGIVVDASRRVRMSKEYN